MSLSRPALDEMSTFNWGFNARTVGAKQRHARRPRRAAATGRTTSASARTSRPCTQNDLVQLADALRPLGDHQLEVLGLSRATLLDDLTEMVSVKEALESGTPAKGGLFARLSTRLAA